ncbi:MAG: RHS repeat-associated core domain-containing protein, partial [Polaribacter sp.]
EENNYYPFGLKHKGYNNVVSSNGNSVAQKFGYQGVELEESLGLDLMEMNWRQYDSSIGRFIGIDPVTHHSSSTYSAFDNNPIFYSDPSGADSQSFITDLFNRSSSGRTTWTNDNNGTFSSSNGQTAKCDDCKYEIFNAFFVGNSLSVGKPNKNFTVNDIIGYGMDPAGQSEDHRDALFDAINSLDDNKLKLKLLKKLGIVGKNASKVLKFLSSKKYDAFSTLIGLSTNDDFLANAPGIGILVDILDDPFQAMDRATDNMIMWDTALKSKESLLGIQDYNNIVIIYSNELINSSSSISTDNSNIINSPRTITKWKYTNVATQIGEQLFMLKTFKTGN